EDGIRDDLVTGVQTCALPICPAAEPPAFLFKDDAFAAPEESFAASDLFALNEQMRRFLAHDIAVQLHSSGPTNGLIEALYSKNQIGRASCRERGEMERVEMRT